jgi:hypothetical protein
MSILSGKERSKGIHCNELFGICRIQVQDLLGKLRIMSRESMLQGIIPDLNAVNLEPAIGRHLISASPESFYD